MRLCARLGLFCSFTSFNSPSIAPILLVAQRISVLRRHAIAQYEHSHMLAPNEARSLPHDKRTT